VTAGLSFIVNKYGQRHSEYGKVAQSLVLFTSPEVCEGKRLANEASFNNYGELNAQRNWTRNTTRVTDIITEFANRQLPDTNVYLVSVSVNDFDACFDAIGRAVLKFHEPGKVGKHIWANVTGGTNVLNAALMQVAYLSGCIPWIYYTFVANFENSKYLQPFTDDINQFRYAEVPIVKTQYDQRQHKVLETLQKYWDIDRDEYISSQHLLSVLQQDNDSWQDFQNITLETFKREFLNVMQGIERKGDRVAGQEDLIRLGEDGRQILARTSSLLFRTLVQRERIAPETIEQVVSELNIQSIH
jgi:hypothetical protein